MTCDDYIADLKKNNGRIFAAESIKMTPAELERMLRLSYNSGSTDQRDFLKDLAHETGVGVPDFLAGLMRR